MIGRITTAGTITEYPIPTACAGPSGIVASPDGALWFTGSGIGRITTSGTITEYCLMLPVRHYRWPGRRAMVQRGWSRRFCEVGDIGRITTPLSTNTSDSNADRKSDILW
jgi:hypothetical protein